MLFRPTSHLRFPLRSRPVMSNYSATVEFFSSLCQKQFNQPLSRLDAANDGFGATLVPCPRSFRAARFCLPLLFDDMTCCLIFQAVMYAVSAVVSAYFFAMWKRADADVKSRVWRRYGWFSALAFFGSCAGLVTAVGDNQYRYMFHRIVAFLEDNTCDEIKLKDYQDFFQWVQARLVCYQEEASDSVLWMNRLSVSPVPYAIEFLCICCANLLVQLHFPQFSSPFPPFLPIPS